MSRRITYVLSLERGIWGGIIRTTNSIEGAKRFAKNLAKRYAADEGSHGAIYIARQRADGELVRVASCSVSKCKNLKPTKVV